MLLKYTPIADSPELGGTSLVHTRHFEKTAAQCYTPEPILAAAEQIKPRDDGVYAHINALGAYEYYGVNSNGDAFPEWGLKGEPTPDIVGQVIQRGLAAQGLKWSPPPGSTYGHPTFVSNAHCFLQHQNQDPSKAIGDVIASAYNDKMHRVELIVFINRFKEPNTYRQLNDGDPVPWSMGARMPYGDCCSICSNVARRRSDYCEHLRDSLRRILPDGRQVFAYNFHPLFFDISRVRVPADKISWTLRKVASYGQVELPAKRFDVKLTVPEEKGSPEWAEKMAALLPRVKDDISRMRPLPDIAIQKLAATGRPAEVAALKGILLSDAELERALRSDVVKTASATNQVQAERELDRHLATRSLFEPHFSKRASLQKMPVTGAEYATTRALFNNTTLRKLASFVEEHPALCGAGHASHSATSPPVWLPFVVAANPKG